MAKTFHTNNLEEAEEYIYELAGSFIVIYDENLLWSFTKDKNNNDLHLIKNYFKTAYSLDL